MYRDLIFYCPNVPALGAELAAKMPEYVTMDDAGNYQFLVPKTPTVRRGIESMALVRMTEEQLWTLGDAHVVNIAVLGTYDEVFADPAKRAIYDRVYPRDPVIVDGIALTPPERFGEFA